MSAPYPAKSRAKLRCPNERPDKRWTFSVEDMRQRNPVNAKRCFKKRTIYCPHLCPENARFSLSFADHVRRSEVRFLPIKCSTEQLQHLASFVVRLCSPPESIEGRLRERSSSIRFPKPKFSGKFQISLVSFMSFRLSRDKATGPLFGYRYGGNLSFGRVPLSRLPRGFLHSRNPSAEAQLA